jgi:hypothetical protein
MFLLSIVKLSERLWRSSNECAALYILRRARFPWHVYTVSCVRLTSFSWQVYVKTAFVGKTVEVFLVNLSSFSWRTFSLSKNLARKNCQGRLVWENFLILKEKLPVCMGLYSVYTLRFTDSTIRLHLDFSLQRNLKYNYFRYCYLKTLNEDILRHWRRHFSVKRLSTLDPHIWESLYI